MSFSKPGFCSLALRRLPLGEALERISQAGFQAVEIWGNHALPLSIEALREERERATSLGLDLTLLSPYFWLTRGEEKRRESLALCRQAVEAARALGIPRIRAFTDCGPDGLPSGRATADDWRHAVESLREMARIGEGLDFVVETHANTLADTPASARRLMESIDRPQVGLNLQIVREPEAAFDALAPWVRHLHLHQIGEDDAPRWLPSPGIIDFPRLFNHLRRHPYRHTLSVEYCWGVEPSADEISEAHRFVEKLTSDPSPATFVSSKA